MSDTASSTTNATFDDDDLHGRILELSKNILDSHPETKLGDVGRTLKLEPSDCTLTLYAYNARCRVPGRSNQGTVMILPATQPESGGLWVSVMALTSGKVRYDERFALVNNTADLTCRTKARALIEKLESRYLTPV
jgi:hypothetical protein